MNVLICGYGRMGKEVETILVQRGHRISSVVDPFVEGCEKGLTADLLEGTDTAIEFSLPDGLIENIRQYSKAGVAAVIGTTGWDSNHQQAREIVEKDGSTILWGYNFAIGAHIFFHLTGIAADLLNKIPGYDIWLHEIHHRLKKDSPSGTAKTAAKIILEKYPSKKSVIEQKLDRAIQPEELHVSSSRGGNVCGTHTLYLDSEADTIEITHRARNRKGLAFGAVLAMEWLQGRKGFFSIEDFISDIVSGGRK